jgi:hypothetical protein
MTTNAYAVSKQNPEMEVHLSHSEADSTLNRWSTEDTEIRGPHFCSYNAAESLILASRLLWSNIFMVRALVILCWRIDAWRSEPLSLASVMSVEIITVFFTLWIAQWVRVHTQWHSPLYQQQVLPQLITHSKYSRIRNWWGVLYTKKQKGNYSQLWKPYVTSCYT